MTMISRLVSSDLLRPEVEVIVRVNHERVSVSVERRMDLDQVMVANRLLSTFDLRMSVIPEVMFEEAVMSQLETVVKGGAR